MPAGYGKWTALATAIAAIATSCEVFFSNHDIDFHLSSKHPTISKTWDTDEELPERLR